MMKASEYLQLRHDELAFSDKVHWGNHIPKANDEACLLAGGRYHLKSGSKEYLYVRKALREVLGVREDMVYDTLMLELATDDELLRSPALLDQSVGRWNDKPRRTLVQVLDLIQDAILLAKEAGD
jgi:hypothetical protein